MLTVRCPKCHHDQKCDPKPGNITDKVKRCVYCGHSFKIHIDQTKSRIMKVLLLFLCAIAISSCSKAPNSIEHHGIQFLSPFDTIKTEKMIAQNESIIVTDIDREMTNKIIIQKEWEKKKEENFEDGGISITYYVHNTTGEAVKISRWYDLLNGKYKTIEIQFYSKDDVPNEILESSN